MQLFAILLISVNMLCPSTTPKPDHMYLPSAVSPILFLLFVISRIPRNVAESLNLLLETIGASKYPKILGEIYLVLVFRSGPCKG